MKAQLNEVIFRVIALTALATMALVASDSVYASHCKGKHANDPGCSSPPPPPPPPPPAVTDPKIVYTDDSIWLANADGSGKFEIGPQGGNAKLDAGMRLLYYDSFRGENLFVRPFSIDESGIIVPGEMQTLVFESDLLAGNESVFISPFGIRDWAQGGDQYAYTYYSQQPGDSDGKYRIMVAPIDENHATTPFSEHTLAWDGAYGGGMGDAAWDASGNYLYLLEDFNISGRQDLLVIDVRTNPGTVVATADLRDWIGATGFDPGSNMQTISAGSATGATALQPGSYSFDPGAENPISNDSTSLCLMVSFIDWSLRENPVFTIVFDLPGLFDPASGLSCHSASPLGTAIVDFKGEDFTDSDAAIIGGQSGRRYRGIWIHDIPSAQRTRLTDSGVSPDWSN